MWILVVNELRSLRNYLLQMVGFITLATLVFIRSEPQFVTSYFTIFPIIMAMMLPQISFTQEERANTFVFLRSLPLKPRDIVAAKYIVSGIVTLLFLSFIYVGRVALPSLNLTYSIATVVVIASCLLAGISYFQHFALGLKSAKTALLITFLAISGLITVVSQNATVQTWLTSNPAKQAFSVIDSMAGNIAALLIGACIMYVSYRLSAALFTKRDVSQLP